MEQVKIETPEHIEFTYELAGLGSRFLACIYDTILLTLPLVITYLAFIMVMSNIFTFSLFDSIVEKFGQTAVAAFLFLLVFLVFFGYFPFFEAIWNGQTPGKKIVGLRVIKAGGYPIHFHDVFLRNLFRIVDFLPLWYGVGMLFIFFDTQHRRLGDMIAQTLVIKERTENLPQLITKSVLTANPIEVEASLGIQVVTEKMYAIIRDFLLRRGNLDYINRSAIAKKLANPLLAVFQEQENYALDCEEFLEKVASQYRQHKRI